MVEYVQTDVWVRFQRLRGHRCLYVCASDAHGTPTMLRAEQEGIAPEVLVERVTAEHARDFATYRISVDNYLTTHSPENEELTAELYRGSRPAVSSRARRSSRRYDEKRQMFLPDRYVNGTCPNCGAPDQYGDSCENCGATYSPLELKDAVSTVSGTTPTVRESEHLFLKLSAFEDELRRWVPEHVDAALARKLDEWFKAGAQGLGHLARRAVLRLPHSRRARQVLLRVVRRADRLHGELPEPVPARRHRLRRVLGRRRARTSSITSSARTSPTSTRCSGRRCSRAPATASRAACSCTAT